MSGFGTPDPPTKPAPPTHIRLTRRIFLGVGLGDGEIGQVFAIVGDHRETTATSMGRVRASELVSSNGADYIPAPRIAVEPTPPIRPPETLENTSSPASSAEEPARVSDAESGAGVSSESAEVGGGTGEEASGGGDPALSAADSPLVAETPKSARRK